MHAAGRRPSAATLSAALLALVVGGAGACATFQDAPGGDDGGTMGAEASAPDGEGGLDATAPCVETCSGKGPSCTSLSFPPGDGCPPSLFFSGDTKVTRECIDGRLHLAASGTLDVVAAYAVDVPLVEYATRVGARVAVKSWTPGPLLRIDVSGVPIAEIDAEVSPAGRVRFVACAGAASGCGPVLELAKGEERLFVVDASKSEIAVFAGCERWTTLPGKSLPKSGKLTVRFGRTDGDPIDGTLDDLVVSFR